MRPNSIDLNRPRRAGGGTFLGGLFVLFVIFKMTPPVQTWSWWAVTAPLWVPVAVAFVVAAAKAVNR